MTEKLCVFCEHFRWSKIDYTYYSTLTGGELDGGPWCAKDHFSEYVSQELEDEEAFRQLILRAGECQDYTREPPK